MKIFLIIAIVYNNIYNTLPLLIEMSNESVLITGSSRGLGENLALVFTVNSYNTIIHGRDHGNLSILRNKILEYRTSCDIIQGDLRSDETIENLVKIAWEKDISVLINNAGTNAEGFFEDLPLDKLEEVLSVNLIAPIKLTKGIYPLFLKKRKGIIINISSIDAQVAKEKRAVYSASKWGLRGFTDSLKREAKKNNIRIIAAYLGGMKTAMYSSTGRDAANCMEPYNVANIIYETTQFPPDVNIDEITINRQIY